MPTETRFATPRYSENAIYLRRRQAVLLPDAHAAEAPSPEALGAALADHLAGKDNGLAAQAASRSLLPLEYVASVSRNFEALGYLPSPALLEALRALSLEALTGFYHEIFAIARAAKGAHRVHRPLYPNFPAQVMEASLVELYLNAILHYWSDGTWRPSYELKERLPLLDPVALIRLDLGSRGDFEALFGQLVGANTSLSAQDREDLDWFVATYRDDIGRLIPARIPQKETRAYVAAALAAHTNVAEAFISAFCTTATDVLRLAVALSGGDVSLSAASRFGLRRSQRRLLLALLERIESPDEDMARHAGAWKRLAYELHAGEFAARYPRAFAAISLIRADAPIATVSGALERALEAHDVPGALAALSGRPGDLARRLDHLLRTKGGHAEAVLAAFAACADRVSTPVLLGLTAHFAARGAASPVRVFFPKGSVARAAVIANATGPLDAALCDRVSEIARASLRTRFAALPSLGAVYLDPALAGCLLPAGGRSASKGARTIARGSRFALPDGADIARFFVWWRNMADGGRVDVDLSAALFDADFGSLGEVSYYNLRVWGGVHSGDIVDAPEGASEFIDVDMAAMAARGVRYVGMVVTSYTQQPFATIPECFAGWMLRAQAGSGEIYDPRTVVDRLDITSPTKMVMPLLIDLAERAVIWADMTMRHNSRRANAVFANRTTLAHILMAVVGANRPNLYDLMALHAAARGRLVASPQEADITFGLADGFPFRAEEIAATYMANGAR